MGGQLGKDRRVLRGIEGRPTGQQFEQGTPERVDVAAAIRLTSLGDLFGQAEFEDITWQASIRQSHAF